MEQEVGILLAIKANKYKIIAIRPGAVFEVCRWTFAVAALANCLGVIAKIDCHAIVKHTQATFP
ncbi:hypothetical protein D3C80_2233820 [compost metagenome]